MYGTIKQTIEQMTCEELTSAYVILRHLYNQSDDFTDTQEVKSYVNSLLDAVGNTHHERLEDMRKAFYEGRTKQ